MTKTGVLLLTVLFAIGCTASPEPRPAHKRSRPGILFPEAQHQPGKTVPPPAPPKSAPQSPQPKAPVQYSRPTVKRAPVLTTPRTFHLPSVIHHKDQSVMVRVPAGSYWVPSQPVSPFVVGENTRMERKHINRAKPSSPRPPHTPSRKRLFDIPGPRSDPHPLRKFPERFTCRP